jgi:hypothetical protein
MNKLIDEWKFKMQFSQRLVNGTEAKCIEIVVFFSVTTQMVEYDCYVMYCNNKQSKSTWKGTFVTTMNEKTITVIMSVKQIKWTTNDSVVQCSFSILTISFNLECLLK